ELDYYLRSHNDPGKQGTECGSIPAALDVNTSFGKASGYKINMTKSILFPINETAAKLSFSELPFKVAIDSLTYLGVCVTQDFKTLFKKNQQPALDKVNEDLKRWASLPISLAGR
ncbi:hypothetical protein KUCAC02_010014, partial [Chaenocephalus aceratus]